MIKALFLGGWLDGRYRMLPGDVPTLYRCERWEGTTFAPLFQRYVVHERYRPLVQSRRDPDLWIYEYDGEEYN